MLAPLKNAILVVLLLCIPASAGATGCADLWAFLNSGCRRLVDTYEKGGNDLIVSGYSWHVPWSWTAEKRAEENSNAWGGGLARTVERENGDTDTVYFLAFSHSKSRPQYNLGYGWSTYWGARDSVQPGLGYTLVLAARNDVFNGWPFPAVLPTFSLRYQNFTLSSAYIPTVRGVNNGNVLYIFGRIALD